jgi:hypothetical protein
LEASILPTSRVHRLERHRVDVDEGDLPGVLLAREDDVGHEALGEDRASGADQDHFLAFGMGPPSAAAPP